MALFKVFRGKSSKLNEMSKVDGHAYFCTDDGSFHIDYVDADGNLQRKQVNESYLQELGYKIDNLMSDLDAYETKADAEETYNNFATLIGRVAETASSAKSIAEGRNTALVYADIATMTESLKRAPQGALKLGDNIYIEDTDVPDYWISKVLENNEGTYGYYEISPLETNKVDLSNVVTTDTDQYISGQKIFDIIEASEFSSQADNTKLSLSSGGIYFHNDTAATGWTTGFLSFPFTSTFDDENGPSCHLELPDEHGTLATQEWVLENTGSDLNLKNGAAPASLQQEIIEDDTKKGSIAHGKYSVALNQNNNAYQRNSIAIGGATQAGLTEEEFLDKYPEGVDEHGYNYEKANSYAFSSGQETKSLGRGAFVAGGYKNVVSSDYAGALGGGNNIVNGEYSATLGGYDNEITETASKSAIFDGYNNKVSGESSGTGGADNNVAADNSHVFGLGLEADESHGHNKTVVGKYNDKNSYAIFQVGGGKDDSTRYNIFEVFENGVAQTSGGKLLTENDLNIENGEGTGSIQQRAVYNLTNIAKGQCDVVFGEDNISESKSSLLSGIGNRNTGLYSIESGYGNTNSGNSAIQTGYENTNAGNGAIQSGLNNKNTGRQTLQMGSNNTNMGVGIIQSGTDNQSYANYGIVNGTNNYLGDREKINVNVGACSIVVGANNFNQNNKSNSKVAQYAAVFGRENNNQASCALVAGRGLYNTTDYKSIVGKYNSNKADTLFEVGNGTADTTEGRSNAFEVYKDGNATVQKTTDNATDIVNVAYLKNHTSNLEKLIDGLTEEQIIALNNFAKSLVVTVEE